MLMYILLGVSVMSGMIFIYYFYLRFVVRDDGILVVGLEVLYLVRMGIDGNWVELL